MGGVHFDTRRNAHLPYENLTFCLELKTLSRMGKGPTKNATLILDSVSESRPKVRVSYGRCAFRHASKCTPPTKFYHIWTRFEDTVEDGKNGRSQNCPETFWPFLSFFWSSRGGPGSLPGALGVRRGDFESFPSEKRRLREQPRPGKTAFFGIGLPPTREHRF